VGGVGAMSTTSSSIAFVLPGVSAVGQVGLFIFLEQPRIGGGNGGKKIKPHRHALGGRKEKVGPVRSAPKPPEIALKLPPKRPPPLPVIVKPLPLPDFPEVANSPLAAALMPLASTVDVDDEHAVRTLLMQDQAARRAIAEMLTEIYQEILNDQQETET
jgi:hypothetical protein